MWSIIRKPKKSTLSDDTDFNFNRFFEMIIPVCNSSSFLNWFNLQTLRPQPHYVEVANRRLFKKITWTY